MKNKILLTALLIITIFTVSYGQNMVINGDFENNTAPQDMINCTRLQFDTLMNNVYSFGTWPNADIIESNGYCQYPEHGKWFIALTSGGTDDVALQLSQPIVAGNKYVLSFWDAGCEEGGSLLAFEVGISSNDSTLGTVMYKAPECVNAVWSHRVDTFTATTSGSFITFQGQVGSIFDWGQLDNVTLTPVTVTVPLTVSLNMPSSTCSNQSVSIASNGNVDSTDSYVWNFSNGNIVSGSGAGPYQVAWTTAGTYYISLTVASASDTTTTIDSIVVNAIPTSSFSILDTTMAAGQTNLVKYTGNASSPAIYNWNFNNALIEANNGGTSYNLTWAKPGGYNVTLAVSQNGCSSSTTQQAVMVVNPLTVSTPICTDSISMLSYLGFIANAGNYNWSFSGANIIAGSGAGPYTLQYTTPGSYPVSLNVTIDSVTYSYTDTIVVSSSGDCFTGVVDSSTFTYNGGNSSGGGNNNDSTITNTPTVTTGVNSPAKTIAINSIYPNPTMGNLNITLNTLYGGAVRVNVYDVLGRTIISTYKSVSTDDNTIVLNTAELPAGTYFIRLSDDNSDFSGTQKFVKVL